MSHPYNAYQRRVGPPDVPPPAARPDIGAEAARDIRAMFAPAARYHRVDQDEVGGQHDDSNRLVIHAAPAPVHAPGLVIHPAPPDVVIHQAPPPPPPAFKLRDHPAAVPDMGLAGRLLWPVEADEAEKDARERPNLVRWAVDDLEAFRVTMGQVMTRNGGVLDTRDVRSEIYQVAQSRGDYLAAPEYEGTHADDEVFNAIYHGSIMWVCVIDRSSNMPVFYSHVCVEDVVHHTSLTNGGPVVAAGEWVVKRGALQVVTANSGHYRPPIDALYRAVLQMGGAKNPDTTIYQWDNVAQQWCTRPINDFIARPTDNKRYWVHPKSEPL